MELSGWIRKIYKDRDYLTRKKALHLFVFNVASIMLGISSNFFLWFAKGHMIRVGFSIMTLASVVSLILLLKKKFDWAVHIILLSSFGAVTIGWYFGLSRLNVSVDMGNKNIVLAILIMIFLYFANVKRTLLIAGYCFILIIIDEVLMTDHQDLIHIADRIGLFAMFVVISILAVQTLHGSVEEKNELIQEIHHRVRNNLQVLSGLVEIHSGSDKDKVENILSDFQDRILAISQVHNYLYKSENYFDIDFSEVIDEIIKNLSDKFDKKAIQVRVENSAEPVFLRIESALPCAMIFSELLSNSLKHAFPSETDRGNVNVLFQREGNKYRLEIKDNGAGISDSNLWMKPKTSGFTLIQILTKQIKGSFKILSASGSTAILEFGN
ncbi:sensor histidine kinase [Leptospira kmetyi]|uniref:histidine kinase n=1 Tax=Leptospira kmetyi TaxID=408139 RepID=A0AAD0UTC0_9LEPT|nr:sensor histidine kinase [Leptospira kmetyi]AYV55798.1 sensor histidine kinase [Leptospira kmetyi]EQA52533.1 histidine kinase [Leptospira kmetyi serovar Malaysia str. Bejo-Iso9]PJZ30495.1 histidine kinase [Leptospira kmetyi]PJZ40871.1 histidine kinase [Leptospira kmetyi]